jgi:hypothetical protein
MSGGEAICLVHFFCLSKRNEPKKKTPAKPTSIFLAQNGHPCLNRKIAVRTFAGPLPAMY